MSKCFLTTDSEIGNQRMRMLLTTNFLVMDPAIFGPRISKSGKYSQKSTPYYNGLFEVTM
jgi:hypothetical protein